MSPNCLERNVSTVATQALHLMNDRMVEDLAKLFAEDWSMTWEPIPETD